MQASRNNKHKSPKFVDLKLFIAALTVAITLGLWNLFSNNAVQADRLAPTVAVDVPAQPPVNVGQDLPPMPTLVPVLKIVPSTTNAQAPANPVQPASSSAQPGELRSVAIPTQTIIQRSAPVVQSAIVVASGGTSGGGGGGGGRGGGSAPAPVTSTQSSRPK
jgi:hypothetical protein